MLRSLSALTVAAAMLAGAGGCTSNASGPAAPNPDAAALAFRVEPGDAASGLPLGTQPVIEVRDADGNVLSSDDGTVVTAEVSTGSGTLSGAASVTASRGVVTFTDLTATGTVGNWTLRFSAPGLDPITSAAFRLAPGPVSASRSTISVSRALLAPGEVADLVLRALDAQGNQLESGGSAVTFTTTGGTSQGTISATVDRGDGTYAATFTATSAGTATTVGAAIDGDAVTSQRPTITVREDVPPAQGVLVYEGFEDTDFGARGWYDSRSPRITTSSPAVGSASLEMRFAQGATTVDASPGRHLFDETEVVFFSYWVKYSANWVGSQVSSHPHEFYFLTNLDDPYVGPAGAVLEVLVEQTHNRVDGMTPWVGARGRRMFASEIFTDAPGPRYKGDWHFIEVELRLNTPGVADGVARYWMDGDLLMEATDVLYREAGQEAMRFNQLLIAPYISVGSPVEQTMWVDDLTIATEG